LESISQRNINALIYVEEKCPILHKFVSMQAIVYNEKPIMVITIKLLLLSYILQHYTTSSNPRLQHLPNFRMHTTGIVENEVRSRGKEFGMIDHPLSHSLRIQITVQRGATVEIIIEGSLAINGGIVGILFLERNNPLHKYCCIETAKSRESHLLVQNLLAGTSTFCTTTDEHLENGNAPIIKQMVTST
jgi:hypothetical protein